MYHGYKKASSVKILSAIIVDLALTLGLSSFTIKFFDPKLYVLVYYFVFLQVVPTYVFSQSAGKFFLGIKVVDRDKFTRLSFLESVFHSLFLYFLSNQIIVDLNDEK